MPRPFYLPDHLSFASESIIIRILERLGFEILSVKKYPSSSNNTNIRNQFPYEGIRLFFDSSENHLTIRSSSTESKIRLFLQLNFSCRNQKDLVEAKINSEKIKTQVITEIKRILLTN